ncbi:MAG: hypothetical protein CMM50_06900 [Rhodospirillaceae bacterium]|nr:hypothetical protein [Rhodospirillaceae bacterium]
MLLGVGLLLGLTGPGLTAMLPIWLLLGAGSSLVQTPAGRLLRRSAHEGDRPAVFAAQFALSHGCWLIAYPLAGWVGGALGLEAAFAVLALIALAATAGASILWPAGDPVELEHRHEPTTHEHLHVHDEHHHQHQHQHQHEGWEGPEPAVREVARNGCLIRRTASKAERSCSPHLGRAARWNFRWPFDSPDR